MRLPMKKILKSLLLLSSLVFFSPQMVMAESYPTKAGGKMLNGITNVATGIMELPKTVIMVSRSEGVAYGATAGFMMGVVQMAGRTLHGALDVATFWIPTKPLVTPDYIWEDFNKETSYNSNLQLR